MLKQLQEAYEKALGNVIFVDFKQKKIIKGAAYVSSAKSQRFIKAHD